MNDNVFRKLGFFTPLSSNSIATPQVRKTKKIIQEWFQDQTSFCKFNDTDKLYGRIIYFNHDGARARDIHNIIKPMFDELRGSVYRDDKTIVHFEGIRLDMEAYQDWFELELDLSSEPDLVHGLQETACYIEVGRLPMQPSTIVIVKWLQVLNDEENHERTA